MSFLDSRLYRMADTIANLILLNLLWLLVCIPMVTAFPATAAMFGVVREWVNGKESHISKSFFAFFVENLWQSLWVGCLWTFFGTVLVADFLLLKQGGPLAFRVPLLVLLAVGVFLYAATSVYLFPVMVNYTVGWRALLRNSLFFAIGHLRTTFTCLVVIVTAATIIFFAPITVLAAVGITSYLLYRICNGSFEEVNALKETGVP